MAKVQRSLELSLADIEQMGPYFQQATSRGSGLQVDWLFVRRDGVWTMMEFKYTTTAVGRGVIADVQQKIDRLGVPSNVTVQPVLVAAAGAKPSVVKDGFFTHILTLKDLV